MPVLDHATQPANRIDDEFHVYGCHNGTRKDGYWAPDEIHGAPIRVWIEDRMSKECRFDLSLTDPSCTGCEHLGKGEAYDRMVRLGTVSETD